MQPAVTTNNDSGIPFAESAAEVRSAELAVLSAAVSAASAKVDRAEVDVENAELALDCAKHALDYALSPDGEAAYAAAVVEGERIENRSPEEKAADAVAVTKAAYDAAVAAQQSLEG